jgi:cyclic beta-1,2-glucan synthetase
LNPCIPHKWPGFSMCLKHGSARYEIHVANPEGVSSGIVRATVDGTDFVGHPLRIAMADDGATHDVMVTLG